MLKIMFIIGVVMSNRIFVLVFFYLVYGVLVADHIAAPGPLQLIDRVDVQNNKIRGVIIKQLGIKSSFFKELKELLKTYSVNGYDKLPTYQEIMNDLDNGRLSNEKAVTVIKIFEYLIMDLISDELYLFGNYTPYLSTFFTGVRYKWANPFSWLNPWNYFGENNDKVYQLFYEFDQLADIACKYDFVLGYRLKLTAFSYLHWRKVIAASVLVSAGYIMRDKFEPNCIYKKNKY